MLRPLHILSIAFLTASLVLAADIGATLLHREPISALFAAVKQGEAADQLERLETRYRRRAARDADAPARERSLAELARRFARQATEGEAVGRIRAPAMDGLDAVAVQGTDAASLEKGPAHYPQTGFPGEGRSVAIAGHRTTYLAPFRHIDSMRRGDPILLEMPYGEFEYRVQRTAIVAPTAVGVIRDVGYERLVLSSCNPLYSAAERFIVFARLVRARPLRA